MSIYTFNKNREKKWMVTGRIRTYKWVKSDQLAEEYSDEDDNVYDPGTPGIEQVDDESRPDFNKIEADTETVELERKIDTEEARERQEAEKDNIIEHALSTKDQDGNEEGKANGNSMDIS